MDGSNTQALWSQTNSVGAPNFLNGFDHKRKDQRNVKK